MAARAFVFALGVEVFFIAQGEVDHAAFARRHGSKTVGDSGLADFFGGGGGRAVEFLQTQGAMVLTIEGNLFVVSMREMKDLEGEQFEGAEQLGVAREQERGIRTGEVHKNLGLLPVAVIGADLGVHDNAVLQPEAAEGEDGAEELVELIGCS